MSKITELTRISQKPIEELGYYVYALKDPRNNEIFYIGKGKGQRIFAHEEEALVYGSDKSGKVARIRAIKKAGLAVIRLIVRHGLKSESEAFGLEAALIDVLEDQLTNLVHGHNSDDYGLMTLKEVELKYRAQDAKFTDSVILININDLYVQAKDDPYELYEATRKHWRISQERASKIKFVCAVYRGIIREVYEVDKWRKSPHEKYRDYFVGKKAPNEIRLKYIDKNVSKYWGQGSHNPIQ